MDRDVPLGEKLSLEPLNSGTEGVSRRTAIKYGSIGAGMLVAAPTILTLGATPASASGSVSPQNAGAYNDLSVTSLTVNFAAPMGIMVATVTLQSNTQTITASGWTALDPLSTASATGAQRLTSQTFWRYYSTVQSATDYTFSWPTAAPASVVVNKFPTATTLVAAGTPTLSQTGTSRAASGVTPQSGADGPGSILFCIGYSRASALPTPGNPTQTVSSVLYTYTEAGVARTGNNGSQHHVLYPAPNAASGSITVTSMVNNRPSVVRALAIA